jgi:hypothetical protein
MSSFYPLVLSLVTPQAVGCISPPSDKQSFHHNLTVLNPVLHVNLGMSQSSLYN